VIELRRRRHSAVVHGAAVLLGLLVVCALGLAAFVAALVSFPAVLAAAVAFAAPSILWFGLGLGRTARPAHVRAPPPPPDRAA
jgi:hypothetical protein